MVGTPTASPAVPKDRADLLDRSWTAASQLYLQELVPRFDPWLQSALRELRHHELPPGPVIVPCCGPGHELVPLHRLYGGQRGVHGLDLSRGMVELAREAIRTYQGDEQQQTAAAPLEAHVADASCLESYGPAAAVLSVFGLQQMAQVAPQALASWARTLAPGGVAVVVLWPSKADAGGPWALFDQVVVEKAAADGGRPPPAPDAAACAPASEWEAQLTEPLLRDMGDVELLVDRLESHRIEWESIEELWKVMSHGGPWHARRLAQGDDAMRDLEARLVAKARGSADADSQQRQERPLVHSPAARIIVIRRRSEQQQQERKVAAADAGDARRQSAL